MLPGNINFKTILYAAQNQQFAVQMRKSFERNSVFLKFYQTFCFPDSTQRWHSDYFRTFRLHHWPYSFLTILKITRTDDSEKLWEMFLIAMMLLLFINTFMWLVCLLYSFKRIKNLVVEKGSKEQNKTKQNIQFHSNFRLKRFLSSFLVSFFSKKGTLACLISLLALYARNSQRSC